MADMILNTVEDKQVERIWAALAEYGIYSEQDLKEAVKKMKPINIGCMVHRRAEKEEAV